MTQKIISLSKCVTNILHRNIYTLVISIRQINTVKILVHIGNHVKFSVTGILYLFYQEQ